MKLKILILGCGSIGTRHAKNLKSIGEKNIILCDKDQTRLQSLANIIGTNLLYVDYRQAVKENKDLLAAIICTPTSYHVEQALYFAKNGINLFIEKPLSHNLDKVKSLQKIVDSNKLVVMMGHSYMFEFGFIKLKSLLEKKTIGQIYFVTYLQGQFLPDWHPKSDYRVEYTARKNLGGGALLTLTSHSFYLIEWLFGKVQSIRGNIVTRAGKLDVDVDDSVFLLMTTDENVIVQSQNNFIVPIHNHKIIVEGEKGRLEYDFVEKKIKILLRNKRSKILDVYKDPNDRFVKEMKYFLSNLKNNNLDKNLKLESGIRFLQKMKNLVS
ncbi:MAG TPA: Gfo/Idh/MocA family oxidoreductase [Nitrosopumilaceae archaeon]|nr:Gfo/Idh/MocA family oxidoreductase [Nitrosopumilaceae archaeon]